ncbi:polysaccharide pyruvyl transferase family protein [Paenibacillus sp. P96]|uniref:Polysaccharide pyruvyl transferase family protein n=1 Tax=Paenibacillus zeirhizosphaerae TaxID=2987519 RepID=A0ABT9FTJ0_9BACL|nr:polysaccharide pyruvyl transferase family protein [Paenibacillus sp. P96]MDP4098026.1 polysaccharide pyruvyl transferase family protein [Paenibacillus sp. P96]
MANLHPMDELKEKLKAILEVVPQGSEIIYVDYPVYNNGGDVLIMKGTEAFFRDYNIKVRARYSAMDFPKKLSIPDNWIIVCHGGGNFGDLYANHQGLRERVVRDFPSHRIVVMPQTIHFESERKADMAAALFNNHPDLHIFVRDARSYDFATAKFHKCKIRMCPDMAHQLWPLKPTARPRKDVLYFLRTDIETVAGQQQFDREADDSNRLDWDTMFTPMEVRGIVYFQKFYRLDKKLGGPLPTRTFWYKYTDYLMNKAINLFSSYKEVRTSRLHGHILSCLLDMPSVVIDNSYGKNSQYYEAWTAGNPKASLHGASESKLEQPS